MLAAICERWNSPEGTDNKKDWCQLRYVNKPKLHKRYCSNFIDASLTYIYLKLRLFYLTARLYRQSDHVDNLIRLALFQLEYSSQSAPYGQSSH